MYSKLYEVIPDLKETREQIAFLREKLRVDLGEIQVGYEYVIESILEAFGMTEQEIDKFWELSEPEVYKLKM